MTNQKSLDKNKPKELDWEMTFGDMLLDYYMDCAGSGFEKANPKYEKMVDFIDKLLTQQRTELLEEIKKEAEKIDDSNAVPSRLGMIVNPIYSTVIKDIFRNLLNKKDE